MLIQFRFKNFKSFRDDAVLDLSAANRSEHNERLVEIGGEKLLRSAAIFGANASGKTNVYDAFMYMNRFVAGSLVFSNDPERYSFYDRTPFLFDVNSEKDESFFEVFFTLPDDEKEATFNYGFCVGDEGVTEEWLNRKAKTSKESKSIFYRNIRENTLDLKGISSEFRKNIETSLKDRVLIISLGDALRVDICEKIYDWFANNKFDNFEKKSRLNRTIHISKIADDIEEQEKTVKFLGIFDESIKALKIEKEFAADNLNERYRARSIHDKKGSSVDAELDLLEESAGTLKMFDMYPNLKSVLVKGGCYFIDELNAHLHPLLVRYFVLIFLNPEINKNNAQLVFTTHDTWLLSEKILRRDEVWFTEKDSDGVSELYSLAEFVDEHGSSIRKDENYEKNYLLGKYGAIPLLKTIDILGEESDGKE